MTVANAAERLPTTVPPDKPTAQSLLYSPTFTPIRRKRLTTIRTSEADGRRMRAFPSDTAACIYGHRSATGEIRTTLGTAPNAEATSSLVGISTFLEGRLGGIDLTIR